MPRPTKKAKTKVAKEPVVEPSNGAEAAAAPIATAIAEPPSSEELRPPTAPIETAETAQPDGSAPLSKRRERPAAAPVEARTPEPPALDRAGGRLSNRKQEERVTDDKDHI